MYFPGCIIMANIFFPWNKQIIDTGDKTLNTRRAPEILLDCLHDAELKL